MKPMGENLIPVKQQAPIFPSPLTLAVSILLSASVSLILDASCKRSYAVFALLWLTDFI